jgi:hypothetical protein
MAAAKVMLTSATPYSVTELFHPRRHDPLSAAEFA